MNKEQKFYIADRILSVAKRADLDDSQKLQEISDLIGVSKNCDMEKPNMPSDIEVYDSAISLREELKKKGKDENFVDINSWIMGANWCKDYMTGDATSQLNLDTKKNDIDLLMMALLGAKKRSIDSVNVFLSNNDGEFGIKVDSVGVSDLTGVTIYLNDERQL